MKTSFLIAAALAALPAAAYADHHAKGEGHYEAAKGPASPDALADAFCAAVIAEDAAKLAALYTEDADSYGPDGGVVKGRDAIADSWAPFFNAFDNFTCTLDKAGEMKTDKHATVWGLWSMTATSVDSGEPASFGGRYMDISVKTKGGWLYRADHASNGAAAAE